MSKQRIVVFASGTRDGGGSGFENLVQASRVGILDAEIVAVVSNHEHGGVAQRAAKLDIPFIYFPGPFDANSYANVLQNISIEWIAFAGWLKKAEGLDPARTFNIHPALLSQLNGRFGGQGMYGRKLQDAVKAALDAGEITESGFSMHFVTDEYDRGPVFFEYRIPLESGMSAKEIAERVQSAEHKWQPKITNMVVHEEIRWDGKDPLSLIVPGKYNHLPKY